MAKDRALDRHAPGKRAHVIRLEDDDWTRYGDAVGDGRRTADLATYIRWRIQNPTTPLP